MNLKNLLLFLCLISSCSIQAQTQSTENPTKLDINIKTPNVSSMERYGDIPVSLFSGIPNINIPLHMVTVGKHTLPISVSYHASGIKVNDLSGDVGLGWNLSATYSISRTLRGKKDEGPDGYFKVPGGGASRIPSSYGMSNSINVDTFRRVADGNWDTQPDEFNFNLEGYSGKFIIDHDRIITIPDQDISIAYTSNLGELDFILTDPKGIKYYFDVRSISNLASCAGSDPSYASKWQVSKIEFPDTRDLITYTYNSVVETVSQTSESSNYDFGATIVPVKTSECFSSTSTAEKKIAEINYPNGKVIFNYTEPKLDMANTHAIGSMELQNSQNNVLKNIVFSYSYYNPQSGSPAEKKLKLDSISINEQSSSLVQRYTFGYEGSFIPKHGSKAQDIWGYYNGANNTSLIPGNTYELTDALGMRFFVPGGDRAVYPDFTKNGILNKISYPTGGYTEFEYENNRAGYDCNSDLVHDSIFITNNYSVNTQCIFPNQQTDYVDFTATYSQQAQLEVESNQYSCTGCLKEYSLTDLTTSQVISQGTVNDATIDIIAGHTYRLSVSTNCEYAEQNMLNCIERMKATLPIRSFSGNYQDFEYTGGLRVKKIVNYDPFTGLNTVKSYEYTLPGDAGRSSGKILFYPKFDYIYSYWMDHNSGSYPSPGYVPNLSIYTSQVYTSEVNNTSQSAGSSVGYQYVREIIGDQGEGGSTVNRYSVQFSNCGFGFPFVPVTSLSHRNGKLLESRIFNSLGTLLQQTENHYSYVLKDEITGWKASYQTKKPWTVSGSIDNVFKGHLYSYKSETEQLNNTVVTQYLGNDQLTQTQTYLYGASKYYPQEITTTGSSGETVTQTIRRIKDFTINAGSPWSGTTQAMKFMMDNHLNDYTIESFSSVNGKVTGGYINEYELYNFPGKSIAAPSRLYRLKNENSISNYNPLPLSISANFSTLKDPRYELEATYSGFNAQGNPDRLIERSGESSLIWGYEGRYMVARVDHVDHGALQAYLNNNPNLQTTFDNPVSPAALLSAVQQIRVAFPLAMISGYTYVPGIGVSAVSDANNQVTYYEYDNLGRLLRIKDADGALLQTYEYQYQY